MSTRAKTALSRIVRAARRAGRGSLLERLLFETDGQDLIEYAMLTTFIGFAGAAAWTATQTSLGNAYTGFNTSVWNLWEPPNPVGGGS